MATLTELTTPLTKQEIEDAIYQAIETRGVLTSSWKPGAIARTIIAAVAIVLAALSTLQQKITQSGFLSTATGDWLAVVAREVFSTEKIDATFAAGSCILNNTGGGSFSPGVGDVTVINSTTGKTYKNTAAFTLAPLETGKTVPFQAVEAGTASNANATEIDSFQTILLGVNVTNPSAFVALDEEDDEALRARARSKTGVLSPNGPSDAYSFLALSATTDDGASAGVTRVTTVPNGQGNVTVYVATPSGAVSGSIGDTSTPLGAVDEAIQTQATPLAVTASVVSAAAQNVLVTYEIWVKSSIGLTALQIQSAIEDALTEWISEVPIGGNRKVAGFGWIFKQEIEAVISQAVGIDFLIDLSVSVPGVDVLVAANGAPVASTITPTINLVSL